jgi:hypothetical protein
LGKKSKAKIYRNNQNHPSTPYSKTINWHHQNGDEGMIDHGHVMMAMVFVFVLQLQPRLPPFPPLIPAVGKCSGAHG